MRSRASIGEREPVIVCLCYAVNEGQIRAAVQQGARDIAVVGRKTGAGTDCGQCRDRLTALVTSIVEHTEATDRRT